MPRHPVHRPWRQGATILALAAAGLLAACGQGSKSTTVVLTGPADKVEALIVAHKSLAPPVQAHVETLDGGQERAEFHLGEGLPMGEAIGLGKAAAKSGVSFQFSSGTQWGAVTPERGTLASPASPAAPAKPATGTI